jgi:hypothetical protein
MSASAHVQSIQALDDLKGALGRFRGEAQEALGAAEQEICRTLDWLQERLNHWQNEVHRRQEEVRRAAAALARCQASGYTDRDGHDHTPDCTAYEHTLQQTQRRLQEAEMELANVRRWLAQVQQVVGDYALQARRLATQLGDDLPKADALLGRKIADLQAYLAVTAPAGVGITAFAGGASPIVEASQPARAPGTVSENLQNALNRLAGTTAGQPAAEAIQRHGTTVRFGPTDDDAIAHFDPAGNEIVISETLQYASTGLLAAHLAHEGAHVQWDQRDSIDQEYHAFSAQAAVWNQVRGNETDEQCDWVSGMIALGEPRAKRIIRSLYPELPE